MSINSTAELKLLHIKLLVEVIRNGSIAYGATALELNVSKANRIMASLREAFDDPLVIRSGNGLVPSDKALGLLPMLQQMMAVSEQIGIEQRKQPSYQLRIAAAPQLLLGLPQALSQAKPLANPIDLTFDLWSEQAEDKLKKGSLDAVLSFQPSRQPELISKPLKQLRAGHVVAREGHPLWQQYSLAKLIDYPLLRLSPLPFFGNKSPLARYAQMQGKVLRSYAKVSDLATALSVLHDTDAIMIIGVPKVVEFFRNHHGIRVEKQGYHEDSTLLQGFNVPTTYLWWRAADQHAPESLPMWAQQAIERFVKESHSFE